VQEFFNIFIELILYWPLLQILRSWICRSSKNQAGWILFNCSFS